MPYSLTDPGEGTVPSRDGRTAEQVYVRHLPGGGFVAISARPVRNLLGRRGYRAEVIVERRVEHERRVGHEPPAVARTHGPTIASVLNNLFPLAHSNAALAAECLATVRQRADTR